MNIQADFLPFAPPDITEAEVAAASEVVRGGWITTGPKTKEFERAFAEFAEVRHAVAVNSCTAALHLSLEAIGVKAGDEVIVPTLTFAASAEVVRYLDARPVLVDVLQADHQIDPAAVERAIRTKTKAIIPVHFAGQPCDLDAILDIAKSRNIRVIEDAAHSIPASYKERMIGSICDITCFSFYATKPLSTGEGGMATTNDDGLAERMHVMSLHGISKDAWKRYSSEGNWYYEIVAPGYKYNLTDIASAIGLVQLSRQREMHAKRESIAERYTKAFSVLDSLELLKVHSDRKHAWHLFVIKIRDGTLLIDRNRFIEELKMRGIGCSVHFIPLHMHPYYRDTYGYEPLEFPVAIDIYRRCISLPIFSKMTDHDVTRVIEAVTDIVAKNRR